MLKAKFSFPAFLGPRLLYALAAAMMLSACGPKFFNEGFLDELGENQNSATVPGPAFFQIADISPTANDPLSLAYGAVPGSYVQYCIQENSTNVTSCVWTVGSLPTVFSPATTEGNVQLSVWLKDAADVVSSRVDSNVVYADRVAPQIASFTVTNTSPTASTSYGLTYGAVTGTYTHFCILENNTSSAGCTWMAGSLPSAYTVTAANGPKVLSLWLRDAAGNVSTRRDSNSVTLDTTAPSITLTSLTGGQTIAGGGTTTITWTASDLNAGATPIRIDVSADSGSTWTTLASNEANDGTYTWNVPATSSTTHRVRVTFTDAAGNSASSASASDFTINTFNPVVTVTSPNGGEVWPGGGSRNITWTSSNLPPGASTALIEYSLDGGSTWTQIATGEANDGSYTWAVPGATNDSDARIRVTVTDALSNQTSDTSDSNFTIDSTAPVVALTAPNGGEVLAGGSSTNIQFTLTEANLGANPVLIEVSSDGGSTWSTLASSVSASAGANSYAWNPVPSVTSTTYRVRVTATDAAGNVSTPDSSDANFSINSSNPVVAVTSPNGGEFLRGGAGSSHNITWTSSGLPPGASTAKLEYSIDGGSTWTQIATGETNDGSYTWTPLPTVDENDARVRVTVTDSFSVETADASNANFTIDSTAPSVAITAPLAGATIAGGANSSITWTATDTNFGTTPISLLVSDDSGANYTNLALNEANDGTYTWAVPGVDSSTYRLRIVAVDRAGNSTTVSHAGDFTIVTTPPSLASATITNSNPTNTTTYTLTYGAVTGTYTQYCILENDTTVGNCTWTTGALPGNKVVSTTENAKTLSIWIRNGLGQTSTRVDAGPVTLDTTVPQLASVTVTNSSPTALRDYSLVYGAVTNGPYSHYCILENNTNNAACSWTAGTLPSTYTVTNVNEAKALSVWIRDAAGNVSTTRTSNSVTFNGALTVNPSSFTLSATPSTNAIETARMFAVSVELADGRILVVGGSQESDGAYPARALRTTLIVDAAAEKVTAAGPLHVARTHFSLVRLSSGKVLAIGGLSWSSGTFTTLSTTELFDPATRKWYRLANLPSARARGAASIYFDSNGKEKVLFTGGINSTANTVNNVYIFDVETNTWTTSGNAMPEARSDHAQVTLPNGNVLIAAGLNDNGHVQNSRIFNRTTTAWGSLATMGNWHNFVQGVLVTATESGLTNDKVYVAGGSTPGGSTRQTALSIYDVPSNSWSSGAAMQTHHGETAVLMKHVPSPGNARLYIAGGTYGWNDAGVVSGSHAKLERYTPSSNTWAYRADIPTTISSHSAAISTTAGKIVIWGGRNTAAYEFTGGYIYNITGNSWTSKLGEGMRRRIDHTTVKLADGRILACGGQDDSTSTMLRSCAIFDPETNTVYPAARMSTARRNFGMALIEGGKVLAAGGNTNTGINAPTNTTEVYDPATDSWAAGPNMASTRTDFTMTSLDPDGGYVPVLIMGGFNYPNNPSREPARSEVYRNGTFTPTNAPTDGERYRARAIKISPTEVMIIGGMSFASGCATSTEVYDYTTNSFTARGAMNACRASFIAEQLSDGRIFVSTGYDYGGGSLINTSEMYDPVSDTWATRANITNGREYAASVVTANDRVIVFGGRNTDLVQRYNPATNMWSSLTDLLFPRYYWTSVFLLDDASRIVILGNGKDHRHGSEIYQLTTSASFVSGTGADTTSGGDRQYTYTKLSGAGTMYDLLNLFYPPYPLSGGPAQVQVTDGNGNSATYDVNF